MKRTSLEDLLKEGAIQEIKTSSKAISNSLIKAGKDIDAAQVLLESGQYDWSLNASYTAILVSARAYMNSKGYRPTSKGGHVAVVRFLQADDRDLRNYAPRVDRMRRSRHRVTYDEYDIITKRDAQNALKTAREFLVLIESKVK